MRINSRLHELPIDGLSMLPKSPWKRLWNSEIDIHKEEFES